MEKALFIVNPSSGGKEALKVSKSLKTSLEDKGIRVQFYETTGEDDFRKLTREAIQNEIYKVFIFGGDGTISEYVREIANLERRPKIILVPLGTTNNLARALGTEINIPEFISKILSEQFIEKKIDVGQINDDYFISTLSAGKIPEVAWKTSDELKEEIGPLAYIIEGITALSDQNTFDLSLDTESESIFLKDLTLLVVGLSNSVFGIPVFFDQATVDDGRFHLYTLKDSDFLKASTSLASDVFSKSNQVNDLSFSTSFKQAEIASSKNMNLVIDGEKGPAFPIKLKNLEKHLTFLVPENTK